MSEKITEQGGEGLSRREFMGRAGRLGLGALVVGGAAGGILINIARENRTADAERDLADEIADNVKGGMAKEWLYASVWPGLMILPNSIELYSTPTLHEDTKIDWPKEHKGDHLAIQRPFMIRETTRYNQIPRGGDLMHGETLGFWLPDSEEIAFVDRAQYRYQILMSHHSNRDVYTEDYQHILGEYINLEPAVVREDLTWRYLETERSEYDEGKGPARKVCARSLWTGIGETKYALDQFGPGYAINVIPLPEGS